MRMEELDNLDTFETPAIPSFNKGNSSDWHRSQRSGDPTGICVPSGGPMGLFETRILPYKISSVKPNVSLSGERSRETRWVTSRLPRRAFLAKSAIPSVVSPP